MQRKARRKCSAFLYAWMQAQHCWLTLHLHAKTSITDKRPKDQEDDNYDDVVIPATTMRKTCQCMCHECQHMRRKKGLRVGRGWPKGGRGRGMSGDPTQTSQTLAHTFLISHHGKWPSQMHLAPRENFWIARNLQCFALALSAGLFSLFLLVLFSSFPLLGIVFH